MRWLSTEPESQSRLASPNCSRSVSVLEVAVDGHPLEKKTDPLGDARGGRVGREYPSIDPMQVEDPRSSTRYIVSRRRWLCLGSSSPGIATIRSRPTPTTHRLGAPTLGRRPPHPRQVGEAQYRILRFTDGNPLVRIPFGVAVWELVGQVTADALIVRGGEQSVPVLSTPRFEHNVGVSKPWPTWCHDQSTPPLAVPPLRRGSAAPYSPPTGSHNAA